MAERLFAIFCAKCTVEVYVTYAMVEKKIDMWTEFACALYNTGINLNEWIASRKTA